MVVSIRVLSIGQRDRFENYFYSRKLCETQKVTPKKHLYQKTITWTYDECDSLTLNHKITEDVWKDVKMNLFISEFTT